MKIPKSASRATLSVICGLSLLTTACSDNNFTIKGDIEGADNQAVVLEKADFAGRWIVLDSVRTSAKGDFKIEYPATGSSEVYRLRIGDGYA